jgi:hypothetical protein
VAAVVIALIEAAGLAAYAVAIGVSGIGAPDTGAAPLVELLVYLAFAAGLVAIARGLWSRRRAARTPFGIAQVFALIIGWTLVQGAGAVVDVPGYAALVLGVVGLACAFSPAWGEALDA